MLVEGAGSGGRTIRFPVSLLEDAAQELQRVRDVLEDLEQSDAVGDELGPEEVTSAVAELRVGWQQRRAEVDESVAFLAACCEAAAAAQALDGDIVRGGG